MVPSLADAGEVPGDFWLNATAWGQFFYGRRSHFYAGKMREVSGIDPAGMLWVIGFIIIATYSAWHLASHLRVFVGRFIGLASDEVERVGFTRRMATREYMSRLAVCLAWFALTSYLNAVAAVVAGHRTPNVVVLDLDSRPIEGLKTLPDIGHDVFRRLVQAWYGTTEFEHLDWFELPDVFLGFVGSSTLFFILIHPQRLLVLRRMMAVFGFINFLRAICVVSTSLPDASPRCQAQFSDPRTGAYKRRPMFTQRMFHRAGLLLLEPSQHISCGDMIFSGHTVFLVMCCMVFDTYCNKRECDTPLVRYLSVKSLTAFKVLIYASTGAGIFAIIGTRLHYTLDVLIAVYLTWRTWSGYHQRMLMLPYMDRVDARMYRGCGFMYCIKWLESASITKIDSIGYTKARERLCSVDFDDGSNVNTGGVRLSATGTPRGRSDSAPTTLDNEGGVFAAAVAERMGTPRGSATPRSGATPRAAKLRQRPRRLD